ncbi:Macrocin-O-methyltransferase domain-containing protein [Nitrospira japonica]|uniref:Macrocin-O-methyltransferase domain-containing protein n=1 Tax=Nitrospira japonica TaxID=1325564 RepID=A0A1W1I0B4_9BACT|nr:Macrocin-O-methyltransferase domain-containing protein [Nitrospira japonica]
MIGRVVTTFNRWIGGSPPSSAAGDVRVTRAAGSANDHPLENYDDEEAARGALEVVRPYTMLSYRRLITLWQQIRYLDTASVPGAMVECGTWKGGACGMMVLAHRCAGDVSRPLHLFDSFQGLPEPQSEKDGDMAVRYAADRASGSLNGIGKCVGPLEDNQRLLGEIVGYPSELTHYHVGWFQDTLRTVPETVGTIALLRIDGDWYESTKICLESLYAKVSSGGIVVIDDYGKWPGCRKAVDEFLSTLARPVFLNHIDAAGRYVIVP